MRISENDRRIVSLSVQNASNEILNAVADERSRELLNANISYVAVTLLNVVAKFNTIEQILDSIIGVYYSSDEAYQCFTKDIIENAVMNFKTKADIVKTIARRRIEEKDFCMKDIDRCNNIRNLFCHCHYIPVVENGFVHIELAGKKQRKEQIEKLYAEFEQHYRDALESLRNLCNSLNLPIVIG